MRFCSLFLMLFLFGACSLKNEELVNMNLKTQTLMFSQKQKFQIDGKSAIFTLSYLNPVLDEAEENDIFALTITPSSFEFQSLEVFINNKLANKEILANDDALLKYLFDNEFSSFFKISLPSVKNEERLKAVVCFNEFNCFELNFEKYSKSLYYRSEYVDTQYN